jgi:phosphoglucosamine mutase
VVPTPAVAYLTTRLGADLGVVLSASHNPAPDNGIKFFDRGGHKLDDSVEDAVEARMNEPWQRPTGADVGRVTSEPALVEVYLSHLLSCVPQPLDGLRVVVDAANGAASYVAPEALRRAGADVIAIHAEPDGLNINDGCGSTHLDSLREAVVSRGADAGIAHDGDADRCLAIDARGELVDGDQILAILALAMRDDGTLRDGAVVSTVMSNLGFRQTMKRSGIDVIETAVGDRYVLEAMRKRNLALGGEQSGHLVFLDESTTGDGVLTALHLLARMAQTGKSLASLASVMERLPQVLVNVTGVDRSRVATDPDLAAALKRAQDELGESGRVLLRPSGTEPLVRVMVEARSADRARRTADDLAEAVRRTLGVDPPG